MPVHLNDLPSELHLDIAKYLVQGHDKGSLRSWAATSHSYRLVFVDMILKTIHLRNEEDCAATILGLANSQYNQYVKELQFIGYAWCETKDSNDPHGTSIRHEVDTVGESNCNNHLNDNEANIGGSKDINYPRASPNLESIFPSALHAILSGLGRFPCLHTLSVEIIPYGESIRKTYCKETYDEVITAEATESWRALMAKTYDAIAGNLEHRITTFEIINLLPVEVSTFNTRGFHNFLKNVVCFNLSLYGDWASRKWPFRKPQKSPQLRIYTTKLGDWFFNHLEMVTHLSIRGPRDCPLIQFLHERRATFKRFPVYLGVGDHKIQKMPRLQSVYLEQIFLEEEFRRFFVDHATTLVRVFLQDCYCYGACSSLHFGLSGPCFCSGAEMYWAQLLGPFADANPQQLRSLTIAPAVMFPPGRFFFTEDLNSERTREWARRMFEAYPKKILFPYAKLARAGPERSPDLVIDTIMARQSFRSGKDQKEFDRLMGIIKDNVERSHSRKARIGF